VNIQRPRRRSIPNKIILKSIITKTLLAICTSAPVKIKKEIINELTIKK
jgi:hypothetical protein